MKGPYRIILAPLLAMLVIGGSWLSLQRGMARYYLRKAELSSLDAALLERALAYDSSNPEIYQLKGLALYANGSFTEASSEFDRAIGQRPGDYRPWLYRGRARTALGNLQGAESDYRLALSLAPHYVEPGAELGRLLLRLGRIDEGYSYLAAAASRDELLLPEVLNLAQQNYPNDPPAILRAVNPRSYTAKLQSVMYLIQHNMASDGLVSFAATELDQPGVVTVTRNLTERKKFKLAFDLWKTTRAALPSGSHLLVDGDFENFGGHYEGDFGWQVEDDNGAKMEVAVADKAGSSGSRGLEIRFSGNLEASSTIISQLVPIKPKTAYDLTFSSISENLVSGGLPIVSVLDASTRSVIAESSSLGIPAGEWHRTRIEFSTSERTDAIVIAVRRSRCQDSPCPIFGELRMDDFVLALR